MKGLERPVRASESEGDQERQQCQQKSIRLHTGIWVSCEENGLLPSQAVDSFLLPQLSGARSASEVRE